MIHLRNLLLVSLLIFPIACSRQVPESAEPVLATVGDRVITLNDFVKRSRFTPRPEWCGGSSVTDKHAILNALIAEKILALTYEKRYTAEANPRLDAYVQGIREQAMRSLHYEKHALEKSRPDTHLLDAVTANLSRQYQVEYLTFPAHDAAPQAARFDSSTAVNRVVLAWQDALHPGLFSALYEVGAEPGAILGPFDLENGQHLYLRVQGVSYEKSLSETDAAFQKKQIETFLWERDALLRYEDVVAELMQGKVLTFDAEVLKLAARALGPLYFQGFEHLDDLALQQPDRQIRLEKGLDSLLKVNPHQRSHTVFSVGNETWSLERLLTEIEHHPLVFRHRGFPRQQFANELKLAVRDLVRDRSITGTAYKEKLHLNPDVQKKTRLWQDTFQAAAVFQTLTGRSSGVLSDSLWTMLRDNLNIAITINDTLLRAAPLSSVQLFALQQNVPWPAAVPPFPAYIRSDTLFTGARAVTRRQP